jgi:hypothetical protein
MLSFTRGLFAILLFLSACAAVTNGPRLAQTDVRRIADAEVRHDTEIDLDRYEISTLHYIPKGDYWSVTYHLKSGKGVPFSVQVSDKIKRASINGSDNGIFDGALIEKNNFH